MANSMLSYPRKVIEARTMDIGLKCNDAIILGPLDYSAVDGACGDHILPARSLVAPSNGGIAQHPVVD